MSTNKLRLCFRISRHDQLIREVTLTQAVIKIGKLPTAHLQIDDESVSRMHAIVEVSPHAVTLIDLGSTRGTLVNGRRITTATLRSGDVITLGDTRAELAIADAEPAAVVTTTPAAPRSPPTVVVAPELLAGGSPPTVVVAPELLAGGSPPTPGAASVAPPVVSPPPLPASLRSPNHPARALDVAARAEATDRGGGAGAIEVAAMLGDTVVDVKHCMDPRSGEVSSVTWAAVAVGALSCFTAGVAFWISLGHAADNQLRLDLWTRVAHRPSWAFRPDHLGLGADALALGGVGVGVVAMIWAALRIRRERTSPYYRIGTAPGVEHALVGAPGPAFALVAPSGDDFVFNYGAGIDGELTVGGATTALAALAAQGRSRPSPSIVGAIEVPIPAHARICARAGLTTFVVSAVARPRQHAAPVLASLERRTLGYVAGSLAAHLGLLAIVQAMPVEATTPSSDLTLGEPVLVHVVGSSPDDPLRPEPIPDRDGGGGEAGGGPAMRLPEGAAGDASAHDADGHLRIAQVRDERPQRSHDELVAAARTSGWLGSTELSEAIRSITGADALTSGFDTATIHGPRVVAEDSGLGSFGGGRTGLAGGGGCLDEPCGTIATERYLTGGRRIGPGGPGGPGFGFGGVGGRGLRRHRPALPVMPDPKVDGPGYDKQIIRRHVRHHIDQISYCYEKQLLANPTLGGTIAVKFLISATGGVQASTATGFDPEVARCVAGVIGAIAFPAPGNGGAGVEVNYPFQFHAPAL
jgi:FHA domain